jgi:hypothetical protein
MSGLASTLANTFLKYFSPVFSLPPFLSLFYFSFLPWLVAVSLLAKGGNGAREVRHSQKE